MANQVLPVSSSRPSPEGGSNFISPRPNSVMNIIQAAVRVGELANRPIGLVQKISWSIERNLSEIYQLEALPDTIFNIPGGSTDLTKPGQYSGNVSSYPGEPIEIVPGFQKPVEITLSRAVMNSGTAVEALINTGDAAEYAPYNAGAGYDPFATFNDSAGAPTRAITPLQQIRPINLFSLIYSPTQAAQIIYGIKFVDCFIESVGGFDLDATGTQSSIIEEVKLKCPKVRLYQTG